MALNNAACDVALPAPRSKTHQLLFIFYLNQLVVQTVQTQKSETDTHLRSSFLLYVFRHVTFYISEQSVHVGHSCCECCCLCNFIYFFEYLTLFGNSFSLKTCFRHFTAPFSLCSGSALFRFFVLISASSFFQLPSVNFSFFSCFFCYF